MQINYCCTHWGSEHLPPLEFLENLVRDGYSGLEINLSPGFPDDVAFFEKLQTLRQNNFSFIGQLVLDGFEETPEQHTNRMKERLEFLATFRPDFINAHTGRDFFSFVDNCRIIDEVENLAARLGVRVLHETHRGRFSFHLPTLLPYLETFPELQLTGDLSHWCNVSESLLQGQRGMLDEIISHIGHLHARIGSEQSAQAANPFAPKWTEHLAVFSEWWKSIVDYHQQKGSRLLTITPEAGPVPYMPAFPLTCEPLASQWDINLQMKTHLQKILN
jgi:hypothetical protein